MSTYAIGDVQGCFQSLEKLLEIIRFNKENDTLWFTGDLVNRGPASLQALRLVKSLGDRQISVLGNHDFHLLAVAYGVREMKEHDTLQDILTADDRDELIDWLRFRPLCHYDASSGYALAHAGLAPMWNVEKALALAKEVETALRGKDVKYFLQALFANEPSLWRDELKGMERLRCIVNYFTRMRYCHSDGALDLIYKGAVANRPPALTPWFNLPGRANANEKIIFGHWASLEGKADAANVYPLDTGCVWGGDLTAMELGSEKRFNVSFLAK